MNGNICESADQVLSAFLSAGSTETSHHRMVQQQIKCGYGLEGLCCKLCSNGPCRISKARPRGVCGADSDTIAARNFLRSVAAGSGCYIHVIENTCKRLKELAKSGAEIRGREALKQLCGKLDIQGGTDHELALKLADEILEDLRRPYEEQMNLVKKLAYKKRIPVWESLGLFPRGAKDEIFHAVVKTSTNLSSNPQDMLMQCLRLGISTGLYGLVLTNLLNDVIMGEAQIGFEPVGMQVIDPDCINIMMTGHQHSMYGDLVKQLEKKEVQELAKSVGAKGIKIVGCTCVGQDFQLRHNQCEGSFCGHAGNNYTSEAVLMTGCIDLVVSEFNCTLPGIEPLCSEMGISQICLDDVAMKKNASFLPYSEEQKEEISSRIIASALISYGDKKRKGRTNPMGHHGQKESIIGVTEVTLKRAMGGSFQPLIQALSSGRIRGIAAVVGCSNLRAKGHDVFTVDFVKELIRRDILVVSAGCVCGGLGNCGLMSRDAASLAGAGLKAVCEDLGIPPVLNFGPCLAIGRIELLAGQLAEALGVDLPQLPVVVSAPQWLEEQALADGAFALALGFPLHLALPPFVTGSAVIVETLTESLKNLTGGHLIIDTEVKSSADTLEHLIEVKRRGLGLDAR